MLVITSCGSDDDTDIFVPLEIQTQEDFVQVSTLQTISIAIFSNDTNIPASGLLSITSPINGEVVINNSNTPQDISDDVLEYDPALNFVGTDTMQYTICLEDGTNCKTETISIVVFQDTSVTLDLDEFPYDTLSEYNFFNGALSAKQPAYGVLPYEPISSLFTDYAVKERFVWVP